MGYKKYARYALSLPIELEVFSDNEAAIALYKKFGFKEEGLKKESEAYFHLIMIPDIRQSTSDSYLPAGNITVHVYRCE